MEALDPCVAREQYCGIRAACQAFLGMQSLALNVFVCTSLAAWNLHRLVLCSGPVACLPGYRDILAAGLKVASSLH